MLAVLAVLLPLLLGRGELAVGPGRSQAGAAPGWWDGAGPQRARRARIMLAYGSGGAPEWSAARLRYYLAHVRPDGRPDDWFFDTVLFLALASGQWRSLCPGFGDAPPRAQDWRWYLEERLFGGIHEVGELQQAARELGRELGDPRHVVWVIIMIPYPDPRATEFGALAEGERALDLSQEADRVEAVRWYLREVARRWSQGGYEHLRLGGFYWVHEEVPEGDRQLIRAVSALAWQQMQPLYWIPYYGAHGNTAWRELGFDVAIQQPNYYFYDVPRDRLAEAAAIGRRYRMGMELELDRRVLESAERRARYASYLDAGWEYGFQEAGWLAWYDDTALMECARAADPEVRRIYDDTYLFAKGRYRPRGG